MTQMEYKCQLCNDNRIYKSATSLLSHIQHHHKEYDCESYYRKFLLKPGEGVCKTCGRTTKFRGLSRGYQTYCGNKCVWNDPDTIEKRRSTNARKTDLELHEWHRKRIETIVKNNSGSYISVEEKEKRRNKSISHFKKFLSKCDCEFLKYDTKVHFKCNRCGREDEFVRAVIDRMSKNRDFTICHFCNDCRFVSSPERAIRNFIYSFYDGPIVCGDRKLLCGKELDLLFPDKKLAIEFDGLYWHNDKVVNKNYHIAKTNACEKRGYNLIHIFENEWHEKQEIVKSKIKEIFNSNENIPVEKCEAREISYKISEDFLNSNDIFGSCNSEWQYGLFYENELVSVMSFGNCNANECELLRFANKLNICVIGGEEKLFSHFAIDHKDITKITSFENRRWHKNGFYEKLNFIKVGVTPISKFCIMNRKLYVPAMQLEHKNANCIYDCGCNKYVWTKSKNYK